MLCANDIAPGSITQFVLAEDVLNFFCHTVTLLSRTHFPRVQAISLAQGLSVAPWQLGGHGAMHIATLPRCHAATLPRCHAATLPRCHAATLPRCPRCHVFHVATLPRFPRCPRCPRCHAAIMPRCPNYRNVTRC